MLSTYEIAVDQSTLATGCNIMQSRVQTSSLITIFFLSHNQFRQYKVVKSLFKNSINPGFKSPIPLSTI